MMECNLCKKNIINNNAAYILTRALFKVNTDEVSNENKIEEKELVHLFEIVNFNKIFAGSYIYLKYLEDQIGLESTEELKADNSNLLVDEELICEKCEKSFNSIETYFIANVLPELEKIPPKSLAKPNIEQSMVTSLFIMVNIWRASRSKKMAFKLSEQKENEIREILLQIQDRKTNEIFENPDLKESVFKKLRFSLFYFEKIIGEENPNFVLLGNQHEPGFVVVNRMLFTFFTEFPVKYKVPEILTNVVSKSQILKRLTNNKGEIQVKSLDAKRRAKLYSNILLFQEKYLFDLVSEFIEIAHIKKFDFKPHDDVYKMAKSKIKMKVYYEKKLMNDDEMKLFVAEVLEYAENYYDMFGNGEEEQDEDWEDEY